MKYQNLGSKPTRNGFGIALAEMGEKHNNLVVIGADVTGSVLTSFFKEKFPERFISVGVAEQNATTVAAGLALSGKIAVFSSYSAFSAFRNADMLRVSVAYNDVNVKIGGGHAGVTVGPDGATHQSLEEIAFVRALPNMTLVVPADYEETRKATIAVIEKPGPAFIRFGRPSVPMFTTPESVFEIGKANVLTDGSDVAIVACGHLVWEALLAADILESKHGIKARVINNHTIKPIDVKTITDASIQCGAIVTAEEHQVHGGLGGAVAEVVAKNYPCPIEFVGMRDEFGGSGEPDELMIKYGMTHKEIVMSVFKVLERKEKGFVGYRKVSDVPISDN
ncbi:transketolase family protein [Candidatus Kapaibacterium sp.]